MLLSFPAEADNQKKALDAAIQIQSALEILHELPVKDVLLAKAEVHGPFESGLRENPGRGW